MNDGERRHCDFQSGRQDPHSFYGLLFLTIYKADMQNRARLELGFPEEVKAVWDWTQTDGYAKRIMDEYKELRQ
jgi:hypothetical protein